MSIKILLAEDDVNLGFVIADQLKDKGYNVTLAVDGVDALQRFNEGAYHMCVFDVMMPKKDGFTLAKQIREQNKTIPILFLTAKGSKEDKIEGFSLGADDYLSKPFDMEELLLRINALLKRIDTSIVEESTDIKLASYTFDTINFTLSHPQFSKNLTKKEALILKSLCGHINEVVSRENVMNAVWGQDDYFIGRSLDVFITKLRKYFSHDEKIQIQNIHGIGFKLEILA